MQITRIGLPESPEPRKTKKRKLAVVTTYDDLCGIAGFSRCLVKALEPHFDLKVFDLDQFLLRQTDPLGRRKADRHFKAICRQLAKFDVVNLQLEFGTLGALEKDIFRRLSWLMKASRELSVTFHTVPRREGIDWELVRSHLRKMRFADAMAHIKSLDRTTAKRTYSMLRRYGRFRRLSLIVHTRRDRRYLEVVQDFKRVYDHPLSFLQLEDVSRVLGEAKRNRFGTLVQVPEGAKAVGVFGFLSAYKGFETAIRAMRYLPSDHHLYIFGGVHPNDIPQKRTQTYVQKLMREVTTDHTLLDRLLGMGSAPTDPQEIVETPLTAAAAAAAAATRSPVNVTLDSVSDARELVQGLSDSLVSRVHFVGALSDEEFYLAMASCDVVVLPYQEVMQSSSGPASLSIELGRRTLLSRTRGFLQLGRYFPRRLEYFDVGNHLQLASLLKHPADTAAYPERPVSMETLCKMYVDIHARQKAQLEVAAEDEEEQVAAPAHEERVVEAVKEPVVPASLATANADGFDVRVGANGTVHIRKDEKRIEAKRAKRLLKGFMGSDAERDEHRPN